MTGVPPAARFAGGQLDDAGAIWDQRDPQHWRRATREAAERVITACDDIIESVGALRDQIVTEADTYDELRQRRT